MSSSFVALAEFLRPAKSEPPPAPAPPQPAVRACAPDSSEYTDALGAVRRFRAGLDDALEARAHELLRRIACDVLARELKLAPAEVRAIVAAARAALRTESPLAVHVHPEDLPALQGLELEVVADRALERGDVSIRLRSGTIDLSLEARIEAALAALA